MNEVLKVKSLEYSYKSLTGKKLFGIENIDFEMSPGYIYGLVGRNGAGKTTLIKTILTGNLKRGSVWVDDLSMVQNPVKTKEKMGFIIYPEMMLRNRTAYENGDIFGSLYPDWSQERYVAKLKEFGVDMDVNLSELSKGNEMKVMAAFAWGHRPEILFADEPSAGFDPVFRKEFLKFLQEYVEDGKHSVFISTHITEDLDKVADYLMIMHEGKLLLNSSMEDIWNSYIMIRCSRMKFDRIKESVPSDCLVGAKYKEDSVEALLKSTDINTDECEVWKPQVSELLRYIIMK